MQMRRKLLWLGVAVAILAVPGAAGPQDESAMPRQPVLVELFTSEGCSSCPPADALLEKLDREQPIPGAQIVVLSEHVDYWNHLGWNHLGWNDPFSSAAFSARQETYAHRFGLSGPYTPEMVVNGNAEFLGSDPGKAASAIRRAIAGPRVAIRMRAAAPGDAALTVEVDPLPAGAGHKANVYLAQAADSGTSDVVRGENRGRRLHHVSIVAHIQKVGTIGEHTGLTTQVPLRAAKTPPDSRWIAFVQEAGTGRVWGAAMYEIPPGAQP